MQLRMDTRMWWAASSIFYQFNNIKIPRDRQMDTHNIRIDRWTHRLSGQIDGHTDYQDRKMDKHKYNRH